MNSQVKNKKILIVGGTGFIGWHLAKRCVEAGAEVCSFGINNDFMQRRINQAEYKEIDISRPEEVKKALLGRTFDYLFNLGGYINHSLFFDQGAEVIKAHFLGLINILQYLDKDKLKGFVQIGSSDEYGPAKAPQSESLELMPISPYSYAKAAATQLIKLLSKTENFPGTVLRFFLVYGPGQSENRFLPQIIKSCLEDKEFDTSEGKQLRDFCYIDDVVEALILAALSCQGTAAGKVINIASGKPVSIREAVEAVMRLTKGGRPVWGAHQYRPGENMALYADIGLAKEILNWEPKTGFEEGLISTIKDYRSE